MEILESPVPIILGVEELPPDFVLMERCAIIDPRERVVKLSSVDLVVSNTIVLPLKSKLIPHLKDTAIRILHYDRKLEQHSHKRESQTSTHRGYRILTSKRNTTASGDENTEKILFEQEKENTMGTSESPLNESTNSTSAHREEKEEKEKKDTNRYELLVQNFCQTVYEHNLAILNTSIKYAKDKQHLEMRKIEEVRRSTEAKVCCIVP